MSRSIKGTKTEQNLVNGFMAESAAYSRYTFYAKQANKESYFPIEKIFNDAAANELRHSKVFFNMLQGGRLSCDISVEATPVATTVENLAIAARLEEMEGVEMYLRYAVIADDEGLSDIASHFRAVAAVEELHRSRFLQYLDYVERGTVWKRDKPIVWHCLVCGFEIVGTEPPRICPVCNHPIEHFMALSDFQPF